jgi:hypothetical protein
MNEAKVLHLDDFRPRITEQMRCLFCGVTHVLRHLAQRRTPYFECPGCDETASVPEWSLRIR